ncbi:hypothetical protein K8P10_002562 [Leucobacter sp. Psy1]|uniref:hypothetical protein n=1 Tax=Leucobacter sp. Psy1 TaxID=2875729 RepID=UPI001CD56ED5|nr:hypothetical protein [Leucobacter sp. Psy1]UBH07051.1 hypothetical protein K8P10_002562 [Leucobacter sp. Psy1]
MAYTSRTLVLLPLRAANVVWIPSPPSDALVPTPTAQRVVEFDSSRPITEVIVETFHKDLAESDEFGGAWIPDLFGVQIAAQHNAPLHASDLTPVTFWEDSKGLVNFSRIPFLNGHLSADDLDRTYAASYLKQQPQVIYAIPVQGLGAAGGPDLYLLSNLAWLGVGLILSEGVMVGKKVLKEHQLTTEARRMARSFEERGIRGVESIRLWACTRESWDTADAARKLGVSDEMMESIFGALGYVQRAGDGTWRLGHLRGSLLKQQEWINAEPEAEIVTPPDHKRSRRSRAFRALRRLFSRE